MTISRRKHRNLKFEICNLFVSCYLFLGNFKHCKLKFVICLSFVICNLIFISPIHASSLGLSIYPPISQVTIKPGKTITQAFTVQNLSDTEKEFTARLIPFAAGDPNGRPILKPNQKPEWLSFFTLANSDIALDQPFRVKPQSSRQIILTISIPNSAAETDHYLTLLVTAYKLTIEKSNSSVSGSIGANLLLTVSNTENPQSKISLTKFETNETPLLKLKNGTLIFDNLDSITFTATAKNSAKFLSQVRGIFKITNPLSQPQTLQSILPIYILANSEREIVASGSATFNFSPKITDIGQYTANLNLNTETATISSQLKLLFLPIKTGLALLIALAILLSLSRLKPK
jgi:hypothetical protein